MPKISKTEDSQSNIGKRLELTFIKEDIQNNNKHMKWCPISLVTKSAN